MKDKMFEKVKNAKLGDGLTKETAKARYENLSNEKQIRTIPHESLVDIKIKNAMAAGEFDNLPGKGKPLDLSLNYNIPEHLRPAYQILKNSGFVPEEVRLKTEMALLKKKIKDSMKEEEKNALMKQLNKISQQYHFCMEYNKSFK